MRLLRNWFRPKDHIRPVSFSREYEIANFSAKHFSQHFSYRFVMVISRYTYEATSSTAANLVSHLERFWPTSFQFGNVQKAFLLSLRGKIIANILRFRRRRESKLVSKNFLKLQKLFHYGFAENFFNKNVLNALFRSFFYEFLFPALQFNYIF